MASHSGSLVLFDLHKPPHGHPYSQSYINVTLQVVHTYISSSQVIYRTQSKYDQDFDSRDKDQCVNQKSLPVNYDHFEVLWM